MAVYEELKKTPKGQLCYERYLKASKFNNDLNEYSSPPLSGPHKEREFSLLNLSFGLDQSSFSNDSFSSPQRDSLNNSKNSLNNSKNGVSNRNSRDGVNNINNSCKKNRDVDFHIVKSPGEQTLTISQALSNLDLEISLDENRGSSPVSPTSLSSGGDGDSKAISPALMFTQFGLTSCAILEEERTWDLLTKQSMLKRRCEFEDHDAAMKFLIRQKEDDASRKIKHMIIQREQMIDQSQQESKVRVHQRLQEQKQGFEEHQKKIVTKHQEIERQREKLVEAEKKRQQLELAMLNQLRTLFKEFEENVHTFVKLRNGFELKDKLPEAVDQCRVALDKVHANLADQLADSEKTQAVSTDRINVFLAQKEQSLQKIELLKRKMDAISKESKEKEVKEAEQKKIEIQKKEEEKKNAEKALDCGIQSMAYVLKEKQAKEKILANIIPVVQDFANNTQMKKYRFDLQRAVNTPINAISAVSGSHLRDKLKLLHDLLSGRQVQVTGKQVSAGQFPEGMTFCQNLIAKMMVKKGEEQVTSNHQSAFAIAGVIVGLWGDFPIVGDLFLAHLQAVCPYVLPFYPLRNDGQATQDYYRSMGYKIDEDGSVEEQDKFLHRMSGVMRLYCACMVSTPIKGPHPLGVEHAWMWLCRTLNMEPKPDITAAMIFDVLSVTGHSLFMEYKIQFVKLLHAIYKTYLPKLKTVSITNSTVGRLELFLENSIHNNAKVDAPKGLLPSNFWFL